MSPTAVGRLRWKKHLGWYQCGVFPSNIGDCNGNNKIFKGLNKTKQGKVSTQLRPLTSREAPWFCKSKPDDGGFCSVRSQSYPSLIIGRGELAPRGLTNRFPDFFWHTAIEGGVFLGLDEASYFRISLNYVKLQEDCDNSFWFWLFQTLRERESYIRKIYGAFFIWESALH